MRTLGGPAFYRQHILIRRGVDALRGFSGTQPMYYLHTDGCPARGTGKLKGCTCRRRTRKASIGP